LEKLIELSAEGASAKALISQAKGQRFYPIFSGRRCYFGGLRLSAQSAFAVLQCRL
jgi:hypothetical protein